MSVITLGRDRGKMQLGFFFDQTRCSGCLTCVVACRQWHSIDHDSNELEASGND